MGRRGLMIEFRYIHSFKDRHGKKNEERYFPTPWDQKAVAGRARRRRIIEAYHHALATVGARAAAGVKDAHSPEGQRWRAGQSSISRNRSRISAIQTGRSTSPS